MASSHFTFNLGTPLLTAAFAGFVGGDDTTSALTTSHIYGRRNVPALYNTPGTYELARRISALVRSHAWDGLHGGVSLDPDAFAQTAPNAGGPKFTATWSGTTMTSTGQVARVLADYCKTLKVDVLEGGRVTTPVAVTIADLHHTPDVEEHPTFAAPAPFLPILMSIAATAACAAIGDWYSFSMIVLGMLCNAAISTVLRSGDLTFHRPQTAAGVPPGDGYLEAGNEVVVLRGTEGAVASVTRGRFALRFKRENALGRLATCATLATVQCLVQLIVVPQGTVHGQLLFLSSIVVALLHNALLSSLEKKTKPTVVLKNILGDVSLKRYSLGTRAAMAVFLVQVLRPADVEGQLAALIPNNTRVWAVWRRTVASRLAEGKLGAQELPEEAAGLNTQETTLLRTLLGDASTASKVYDYARTWL
ncbi:hypothetical protein BD413DRAFT_464439 [Trametes elegans]|nr:hypothetical protein BD413DRAFT_464439 [Trametes elegans]